MRYAALPGLFVGCVLVSWMGWAADIAHDRMLVLEQQRTFVLGLYENPQDDAILRQVADAGFNLVQTEANQAALDRAKAFNLHAWINVGTRIDFSADREKREKELAGLVAAYAGHPALLAWEVPDEALWNCWYGATQWRRGEEPAQLKARISALADTALAERLQVLLSESKDCYARGELAASEQKADAVWRALGADSPHPTLSLSNAEARAGAMCQGMLEGYARLKRLDAKHPVWMNHAPRNSIAQLAQFDRAADAVGCDIYPVPPYLGGHSDLRERSCAAVGAYTDRMQDAAPGKPVWMVLQGFAWADLAKEPDAKMIAEQRVPTYAETRFMAYDAIVHGARGILYWGTAYTKRDGPFWGDLLKVVRELADLQPVLSAPDARMRVRVSIAPTWGSCDRTIRVLPKKVGRDIWLIVVNESTDPLEYTLGGLARLNGKVYCDPLDTRETAVKDGQWMSSIPAQGVRILRPKR